MNDSSIRTMLALSILAASEAVGILPARAGGEPEALVRGLDSPPATQAEACYAGNRAPLQPSPLRKLPIGSIKPGGWLRVELELERDGMIGHLEEISKWCDLRKSAWASPDGAGEFGWEELPYWLKGYGDLGYVLGDEAVIANARKWIDACLSSQDSSGYFGPRANKTSLEGKPDLWPHMVMCNVLESFYEYSTDPRVIPFLTGYFRWLNTLPGEYFGLGYWPKIRFGDNIQSIYWLYNRTGEPWLLDLAKRIHEHMARWETGVIDWHNVNIAQGFREPAVFYQQARDLKLLDAADRNYRAVMELYGQFPGGGFAGDENCRAGYYDPRQGFETCGIVEFMHSFEMLLKISGNPLWADRCEEIAFNALPAALTPDLKGLHYLTCANQVQLDKANKSPAIQNSGNMFAYSPYEAYRCCQHNVSHGWPYYAEELWLATGDGGLCASLYAPSQVTAKVGRGRPITISEQTEYPFGDTVALRISAPSPERFPLYLRIPRWCPDPVVKVNGKTLPCQARPLSYVAVERTWRDGDRLTLKLPMRVAVRTWPKNSHAASVDYGPLTFSLKIGERWAKNGGSEKWPEWEVFPTTPWNYGLVFDSANPAKSFKVTHRRVTGRQPFTPESSPVEIRVRARKLPNWKPDRYGLVGKLQPGPIRSAEPIETVTLIPMGAARLRIASFPVIGDGPAAREWPELPVEPVTASHCWDSDSVGAVTDGLEPKNSADPSIPRFTWWDHRGSQEWLCYDLGKKRSVSEVAVYWFDDTGRGSCRAPKSWRMLWKDGAEWKPVEATGDFGVARDQYNRVTFKPVQTSALRIEVQLLPEVSAGVLEMKVN